MTDTDLIARAAQALRTEHAGQREGSGFTRARILVTLQRRKRRWLRWLIAAPFGALLLAGSAWAQSSGQLPRLWHALAAVFVPSAAFTSRAAARPALPKAAAEPPSATEVVESSPAEPSPPELPRIEPVPTDPLPTERTLAPQHESTAAPDLPPSSSLQPSATSHPARREPAMAHDGRSTAVSGSTHRTAAPPASTADPELSAFRRAHDLHFAGAEPRAAIGAFADYLAAYPEGRFVPEARYNTALDWLKLGDKPRARQLLEPFARGDYGNYRRDEAARLLEALH